MSTNLNTLAGPERVAGTFAGSISALAQDLAARARSLWDAYWDHQARRATVLMLEALDDRLLKDIGLTRTEIWPVVLGSDPAHALQYDAHWRKSSGA